MEILDNSTNCGQSDLLIGISAQKLDFARPVHKVDTDGITFRDKLISINKIGEGDGRIFFHEFRFDLVEPFISVILVVVDHFIGDFQVLHDHSDSFRKTSNLPITQLNFSLHDLKDMNI